MSGDSSDVPVWVRAAVAATGFALIVSSASDGLIDHPNSVIAVSMLGVGAALFVIGPLMERITEFDFKKLTGKFRPALDDIRKAEDQAIDERRLKQVTQDGKIKGVTAEFLGKGSSLLTESAEGVLSPGLNRVALTDEAVAVLKQLSDGDRAAVESVLEEMTSPDYVDDVPLLPTSARYRVRKVNDDVRLVYRRRDRLAGEPLVYLILNIVRPDSTLWKLTDEAL